MKGGAAMTIEIHEPELEALIQQRMDSVRFRSVEEVLIEALQSSRAIVSANRGTKEPRRANFRVSFQGL